MPSEADEPRRRHVRRQIGDDDAADARLTHRGSRLRQTRAHERVQVGHERHGRRIVAGSRDELSREVDRLGEAEGAPGGGACGVGRVTDHGTVGERVGEGHAELDEVGTRLGE